MKVTVCLCWGGCAVGHIEIKHKGCRSYAILPSELFMIKIL